LELGPIPSGLSVAPSLRRARPGGTWRGLSIPVDSVRLRASAPSRGPAGCRRSSPKADVPCSTHGRGTNSPSWRIQALVCDTSCPGSTPGGETTCPSTRRNRAPVFESG